MYFRENVGRQLPYPVFLVNNGGLEDSSRVNFRLVT